VRGAIRRARPAIISLSEKIHGHPELGYQEVQASAWVADMLSEYGYAVERPYAGMPTALRAVFPGVPERPTIALLAEYDALPDIGHGCGHNLIAAVAVGAAVGLAAVAGQLDGRVIVLGTPAEEGGVEGAGGKVVLLERGAFTAVDAALLLHPSSRTVVASPSRSREALEVSFRGKAAHASLAAEAGASALEALILTFNGLNALRLRLGPSGQVHGIITHGGTHPGTIPHRAAARFYIRSPDAVGVEYAANRLRDLSEAAARATGTSVSFRQFSHSYHEMRPNPVLAQLVEANLMAAGLKPEPAGGGGGSTDMGNVSKAVPALHAYFAVGDAQVATHTSDFALLAGSPAARRPLIQAARAVALTCLDLLVCPEHLQRAQMAHRTP
jgi:amidohydrolase